MNPAAILSLIGELYSQVAQLTQENQRLQAALAEQSAPPAASNGEGPVGTMEDPLPPDPPSEAKVKQL